MNRSLKIIVSIFAILGISLIVQAPAWTTVFTSQFSEGDRLTFVRGYGCFNEDRAGERSITELVQIPNVQEVKSAEVFMTGFNTWYTRDDHDHEMSRLRMDVWPEGQPYYKKAEFTTEYTGWIVPVKLTYSSTDEDTTDDDDFNTACIGFVVVAQVK